MNKRYESFPLTEEEIWKDIPGYEGEYQVSNLGNVKSLARTIVITRTIPECIMTKRAGYWGYLKVDLRKDLKKSFFTVHRLVASAFIPNPENKKTVNHKNGDKTDNRLENLEWATHSENVKHSYDIGISKPRKGDRTHTTPVIQIDEFGNEIEEFETMTSARNKTGCTIANIALCCKGKQKQSKGFYWKFKNK